MPTHNSPFIATNKSITRDPLLNWSIASFGGAGFPYNMTNNIASGVGVEKQVYLFMRFAAQVVLARSTDNGITWETAPASPGGSAYNVTDITGEIDPGAVSGPTPYVLQMGSATGVVHFTNDGGATWSGVLNLPSTGSWSRIRRSFEFGTTYVFGTNKIAASANTSGVPISFSSQTVPGGWSSKSVTETFQPYPRSSGHGFAAIDVGVADQRRYLYTLDGTNWAETALHNTSDGKVVWMTWNEYHKAWFALTDHGCVYRAATLDATWVKVMTLYFPSGTGRYFWIESAGPLFIIHGSVIGTTGVVAGNFIVTDLGSVHDVFQEGVSSTVWPAVIRHNGQLVAAAASGTSPNAYISTARSGRLSYIP